MTAGISHCFPDEYSGRETGNQKAQKQEILSDRLNLLLCD
jgi:hypothetical protein